MSTFCSTTRHEFTYIVALSQSRWSSTKKMKL